MRALPGTVITGLLTAVVTVPLLAGVLSQGPAGAATPSAASLREGALLTVDDPSPGTAALLLSRDIVVVRDMERYLIAVAGPEQRGRMTELGVTWRVLDETIGDKAYYTVLLRGAARLPEVERHARVLRSDEWDAVVEASPQQAERLAGAGFEVAKVFLRPIRPARIDRAAAPARRALVPDPVVQSIVDSVSGSAITTHVQRLQDFVTRHSAHDSCYAAAQYIASEFQSFGIDDVYLHDWSSTYHENVVATIPGRADPDKIVVIGGHYDSTTGSQSNAPGADDNASGTSCILESARVLAGLDFNYTIVFIAFCGEEQGLLGSEAWASEAAARGDDIVAVVAVDMIGYVAGGDAMDLDIIDNASSAWMLDLVTEVGATYVPELPVVEGALPGGASSDHASFWASGFDAILFFEDSGQYSPYIHTSSDIVGVSYNAPLMAERSVKVAAGLVATIAEPFSVAIIHTPLENTENTTTPYRVSAQIIAADALDPDSLLVRYSTGGPTFDLVMVPAGPADEYEAWIPAQPGGTFVDYHIVAADTRGNRVTEPKGAPADLHGFFVGAITAVYADDFEVERGFTVGDWDDTATTGIWERVDPNGTYSGSTLVQPEDDHTPAGVLCWVTGNAAPGSSQGANDVDNGKTTLFSPTLDLSSYSNARVRYRRWYTNDTGSSPETDQWVVDVSPDGGGSWQRIETLSSSDRTWRLVERDLTGIALTAQVQFRFIATDDDPGSVVEAGVDDFSIVVYQDLATGLPEVMPDGARRLTLQRNVPNPFGAETAIRFIVPAPGREVSLRVFDVSGRRVVTLLERELVVGARSVSWNGRDAGGRRVAAGVYFYRLESPTERLSRKLVLLR